MARPIYHKCDETIRGHVFGSFLALVLRNELQNRLEAAGHPFEWHEVLADLESLEYVEVEHQGKRFLLRVRSPRYQRSGLSRCRCRFASQHSANQGLTKTEAAPPGAAHGATPRFRPRNPLPSQ